VKVILNEGMFKRTVAASHGLSKD